MTRTERLFSILQMLREQRQPVTAATIGERFGISERTAYRDIATLTSRGATIVGEAGVGFVLRDDFFIPPLSFDADEAAALMLGLRFVLRRGDADLSNAATRARAKLAAVLPARFDDSAAARSPLVVAPPGDGRSATLGTVRAALDRRKKLQLRYRDQAGSCRDRVVWPVMLGWFDEVEMLAAWCELRQAFRHFRIDRVLQAEVLGDGPGRPHGVLLAEYRALEPDVVL